MAVQSRISGRVGDDTKMQFMYGVGTFGKRHTGGGLVCADFSLISYIVG